MLTWVIFFLSVAIPLTAFLSRRAKRLPPGSTPPGPKRWPFIGNINDIPRQRSWITYTEWAKIYGDIVYVEPLGTPTVILNNPDDIYELLERRSAYTASRPPLVVANELMGWEWDFAHMPHNDNWRKHRKIFHQYFRQNNIPIHFPAIRDATLTLLNQLQQTPDDYRNHIRQFSGGILLKLTYNHDVKTVDDRLVTLAEKALDALLQVIHVGSTFVEVLPLLKHMPAWFPGASFQEKAHVCAQWAKELRDVPFQQAKHDWSSGSSQPCFVSDTLSEKKVDEEIVANAAALAYLAGSDTTASIILSFVLAMLHYPEVQARARKEVDLVTNNGSRLPDFADRPSLPYIDAILAELLRWAIPTPLAFPHVSERPEVYKGYYFPSGTNFIPNVYGIFHDERRFSEPFKFKPERFLGDSVEFNPLTMGAFGYGRRICPGRHVTLNAGWLAIVQILTVFTISPKIDEHGRVVLNPPTFDSGLVVQPDPFEVTITPRSDKALALIQKASE
ncbi:hypothetical protein NP233_g2003 [Leucocoprinus birnbaumii]|uniref:Cytochrome P450 n=1 Tax=Leucocoprinus birnbaumii TaxID=56174 RepID=A0AAD5W242_9AGAR|nr:hypothetical protein NP233_g2003 [Leucocoprinus birnbaumii]